MRRLLLFLLVFGAGSAVLWHFESKRRTDEAARVVEKSTRDPRPERDPASDTPPSPPQGAAPGTVLANGPGGASGEGDGAGKQGDGEPGAGTDPGEPQGGGRDPQRSGHVLLRGEFHVDWPGAEARPNLGLDIADLQPQDGRGERYLARDIKIKSREAGAGGELVLRETIDAKSGGFSFQLDSGRPVGLADSEPLALEDVVVVRHIDAPVVPLQVRAPRLNAFPNHARYESVEDDVVVIDGPGLSGSGRAVVFDGEARRLRLGRGAHVKFALEDGRIVDFWTTGDGPLELTRKADDTLEAVAQGGARLELLGDPPATVDAERIEVSLRSAPTGGLWLDSARARGTVVVKQGDDRYTGDSARVLSPGGELSSVVLNDSPEARVTLRDPDGEDVDVFVRGAGPLKVDIVRVEGGQRRASFVFQGPGLVQVPDRNLDINFEDRVEGKAREDEGRAVFLAAGGVVARRAEVRIETASLTATVLGDSAEEALDELIVVTEGPTILTGKSQEGDDVRVDAGLGLAARLIGQGGRDGRGGPDGRWLLDRAEDVVVVAGGPDPYRVEAGVLRDGDLSARTFTADGDVAYTSLLGEATGTAGMVRGQELVVLSGDALRPARIVLAPDPKLLEGPTDAAKLAPLGDARAGELSALTLELTQTTLDAQGAARGYLATDDGRLELDADRLRTTRRAPSDAPSGEPGGEQRQPEPVTLVADGVRRAELVGERSHFRIAGNRLEADAFVATDTSAGERLHISTFGANGAVSLVLQTEDGQLEVDADELRLDRGGAGDAAPSSPEDGAIHVVSHRVTRMSLVRPGREVHASCQDLDVRGRNVGGQFVVLGSVVVAEGDVLVEVEGEHALDGRCARLELLDGTHATLIPAAGGRVQASGKLPSRAQGAPAVPYSLEADRVVHTPERIEATAPELQLDVSTAALQLATGVVLTQARAGRLVADGERVVFDGGFEATGRDAAGLSMSVKAGHIEAVPSEPLRAREIAYQEPAPAQDVAGAQRELLPLREFNATGGFELTYGQMTIRAESASSTGTSLRLTGWPDELAVLEYAGMTIEATWIVFDTEEYLVSAGRGIIRSAPGPSEFTLRFASIEPRVQGDESLVIIAAPLLTRGRDEMRSDWLSLWLLRDAWRAKGASALYGLGEPPPPPPPAFSAREIPGPDLLAEALMNLQQKEFAAYVRALYAEGAIEVTQRGSRASRADALYLDVGEATGWLSEAELVQQVEVGSRTELVRIRAGRLETDGSGRLVANVATLTTCDHDQPHYVVLTKQLALEPRADGRWRFGARGNRLRFGNGLQVPLPSIGNAVLDETGDFEGFENEKGEVTPLNSLTIAQTARFGASIGASFGFETGRIGRWLAALFGMDMDILRGRWDTEARWLGDRGPLVSAKLELRERKPRDDIGEDFRLEFYLAGIPDRGNDRGVQRVEESERAEERVFGWVRGRYPIVRGEWIDLAFSGQTDPGVQAEFFERDFLSWDERDTYLRWRKSRDGSYFSFGVAKRVDSYRTQVEELPSFGAYLGQREVAALGAASLLYGGSVDIAQLRRREGDLDRDPFSTVPGGLGQGLDGREVTRVNLNQRLDLAVPTRWMGVRSVPFVELDATGWSENQAETDHVTRFAMLGGMELATALRSTNDGFTSVLSPRLGARTDLAYEESGGAPTPFDALERPLDGTVYEAGLRGLWTRNETFENLDLDLRLMRLEDRANQADATELGVLGEWITRVGADAEGRVGVQHDGRYDVEDGQTTYSRSTLAWSPREEFLIEGRYARARSAVGAGLYEAAGVDARWTLDPKWELQLRHTWSLTGEGTLDTSVTVRRFGHDFLLELEVSRRAGEGGTSFGLSFNPLLAWARPRLGLLDRR